MADKFNEIISIFPESLSKILSFTPENIKKDTYEIRLRKNKPLVLFGNYGVAFIDPNGIISHMDTRNSVHVSENELQTIISAVCGYSVYSHQSDIANGFVTFGNGNRVGFCGTAVMSSDRIASINNISSLNIRIAREHNSDTDQILETFIEHSQPHGIIIAGAPCTGKTTILKNLAKVLSSEYKYGFRKCVIVDERFEMSCTDGINCDVICGYDKDLGIVHAIRTLSPHVIICDEIATDSEAEKVIKGLDSGVSFIVSVHASDKKELLHRSVSSKLIRSGGFDRAVILTDSPHPGVIGEIIKTEELLHEDDCCCIDSFKLINDSVYSNTKRKKTFG